MTADNSFPLTALGIVQSCFTDKFGVPRQPGCPHARGKIVMQSPYDNEDAFRGLDAFSHLWLTFIFHQSPASDDFRPLIRPPRLGGNRKVGVFASRSPFRPNRLGLSVVQHHGLERNGRELALIISGLDLVEGTPIVDIKPFLPWSDTPDQARADWAMAAPEPVPVAFAPEARAQVNALEPQYPALADLIIEILSQDPRPAYKKAQTDTKIYTVRLYNIDVHWQVMDDQVMVRALERIA